MMEYLKTTLRKANGVIVANPNNENYSYVCFQTRTNSGFILRSNGTGGLSYTYYGTTNETIPYKTAWIELFKITDLNIVKNKFANYTTTSDFQSTYALKTELNQLKQENAELKAKLAALESNSGEATTKEITKQIVKNSLTLSNIE